MYTLTSRHTNSQHSVPLEKQLPKLAAHVPLIMLASHSCPGALSPLLLLLDRQHLTHISLLLITSVAAIITHLGKTIPRVSFLQRHALNIQNHPIFSEVLQAKQPFCKTRFSFAQMETLVSCSAMIRLPLCVFFKKFYAFLMKIVDTLGLIQDICELRSKS